MESNFAFIKDIFPETYRHISDAEKNVRVDHRLRGVRNALESLIKERMQSRHIDSPWQTYAEANQLGDKKIPLYRKLSVSQNKKELKKLGWDEKNTVLPHRHQQYNCEYVDGSIDSIDEYTFLRQYGNTISHEADEDSTKFFKEITYDISIKALEIFHQILCVICAQENLVQQPSAFDADRMPIQGQEHLYIIDKAGEPADSSMSKCQLEFHAHFSKSGSRSGTEYALIRQYKKEDIPFLWRNIDAVKTTQDELPDGLPKWMGNPAEISTIENTKSSFYIVAYHFEETPQPLSSELLKTFDMKSRLFICKELARYLAVLHPVKVYQRLLSYESVYICDCSARGKGLRPYLVKFDFAKIESRDGEMLTIHKQALEAKELIPFNRIKKYIADDWEDGNWEKADIYSLGVLFCDILSGAIIKNQNKIDHAMEKLNADKQISDELLDFILERMLCRGAEKRPNALEVQYMLKAELEKWS